MVPVVQASCSVVGRAVVTSSGSNRWYALAAMASGQTGPATALATTPSLFNSVRIHLQIQHGSGILNYHRRVSSRNKRIKALTLSGAGQCHGTARRFN